MATSYLRCVGKFTAATTASVQHHGRDGRPCASHGRASCVWVPPLNSRVSPISSQIFPQRATAWGKEPAGEFQFLRG